MPPFPTRLRDGLDSALDHPGLLLVPAVTALLSTDKLGAVLSNDGVHFGIRVVAPAGVLDLWSFVDPPGRGLTIEPGVAAVDGPVGLAVAAAVLVVQSALAAGYFGSLAQALETGSYDFLDSVRAHFVPFLLLNLVPAAVVGLMAALISAMGATSSSLAAAFIFLGVPLLIVVAYLFYATPYLVVLRETGLVAALDASADLATEGGAYARYLVAFLAFVLVVSPAASLVVVNVPVLGLLVGLVGGSVLGVAGNAATMRFVADVDEESPAVGLREDSPGPGTDRGGREGVPEGDPAAGD